jgi:hypothetical protein
MILEYQPVPFDPATIEFEYNSSIIFEKIVGAITTIAGKSFVCNLNYYDQDIDKIRAELLGSPGGMTIEACGETELVGWTGKYFGHDWRILWTPGPEHVGVNYVTIKITDAPYARDSLSDTGILLINVVGGNHAPILGGLTYGSLDEN